MSLRQCNEWIDVSSTVFSGRIIVRCNIPAQMIPWECVGPSLFTAVTNLFVFNHWLFFFTHPTSALSQFCYSTPPKNLYISKCLFQALFWGRNLRLVLGVAIESSPLRQASEIGSLLDQMGSPLLVINEVLKTPGLLYHHRFSDSTVENWMRMRWEELHRYMQ